MSILTENAKKVLYNDEDPSNWGVIVFILFMLGIAICLACSTWTI